VIRQLGYLYEDKYVRVAKELGYNFAMERIDVNTAQAMWDKANINTQSQRTTMRHMKSSFGNNYIIPCSTNTNYCEIDNEVINYWTEPFFSALNSSISTQLYSNREEDDRDRDMQIINLVLGGDYGQQKFRMVMKIICRREDMEIINQWKIKIGYVDCKKDTYEV
jgi:hypothetical protein